MEQIWIFNIKCAMYLCQIVLQIHAPKLSHVSFICVKYFCTLSTDIAVHAQNPVCPADTRKIWFMDKASLYIIPISSQQRSQPRRAGFVWKPFRFLSQCLSDFCQISLQNLPLLKPGISLGKQMGKNSSSCMWLPPQLGPHNTCPLCYIWSQVCNET